MDDYYSVLNIEAGATPVEIKKAYFGLVRKYPPDRYPDDFMIIREAYEVLIDNTTRREYDSVASMPDTVRLYYQEAREAMKLGDPESAIKFLESATRQYKKSRVVNCLLGDAYLGNLNYGKAIKIFKQLVQQEPDNAAFARRLAESYRLRGWHVKAIDQYHYALRLDEDNISLWLGLIDSYLADADYAAASGTVQQALEVSTRKGWSNLDLYYHVIMIDLTAGAYDSLETHLAEMTAKAGEDDLARTNVAWFLATLARYINRFGHYSISATVAKSAVELADGDPEIEDMLDALLIDNAIFDQLKQLRKDPSISDILADMLEFELEKCRDERCLDCTFQLFFYEMDIVVDINPMRSEILKLKQRYPELYNLKKEFFRLVLNRKKEAQLHETYRKKFHKLRKIDPLRFEPEDAGDDLYMPPKPVVRSGPKIGRNEPCPCGSGKKYKKCCGR